MIYRFTSVIMPEDKGYVARCVELGVTSQGKTVEEAQANLKEAVELYLEDQPRDKRRSSKTAPLVTTFELSHG